MSSAEFEQHECDLPLKTIERIKVVYFRDDSYKDKKLMTGWGIDGILYTFEVVPRKPIPITIPLADETLRERQNGRRLYKTIFKVLSSLYRM